MRSKFALSVSLCAALLLPSLASAGPGKGVEKVNVCHLGDDGVVKMLTIGAPALQAHLDHGDWQPFTAYADADGDGYTNDAQAMTGICVAPAGYVAADESLGQDCDDSDASTNPGAAEVCDDGSDNNCNGEVDENCAPTCPTYEPASGAEYGCFWMWQESNGLWCFQAPAWIAGYTFQDCYAADSCSGGLGGSGGGCYMWSTCSTCPPTPWF